MCAYARTRLLAVEYPEYRATRHFGFSGALRISTCASAPALRCVFFAVRSFALRSRDWIGWVWFALLQSHSLKELVILCVPPPTVPLAPRVLCHQHCAPECHSQSAIRILKLRIGLCFAFAIFRLSSSHLPFACRSTMLWHRYMPRQDISQFPTHEHAQPRLCREHCNRCAEWGLRHRLAQVDLLAAL